MMMRTFQEQRTVRRFSGPGQQLERGFVQNAGTEHARTASSREEGAGFGRRRRGKLIGALGTCMALLALGCSGGYDESEPTADEGQDVSADLDLLASVELEGGGEVKFSQMEGGEAIVIDALVPPGGKDLSEYRELSPVELYTALTGDAPPTALAAAHDRIEHQAGSDDEEVGIAIDPTAVDSSGIGTIQQAIAVEETPPKYVGYYNGDTFCTNGKGTFWLADYEHCWNDVWQTASRAYQASHLYTYAYAKSGKIRHRARNNTWSGWQTPVSHDVKAGYMSYIHIIGSSGWKKQGIVDEASATGDAYHASFMFYK